MAWSSAPSITYHDLVVGVPDLAEYAKAGLVPADAELEQAIDEHARIVASYREATATRDEAQAIARNAETGGQAIARAIRDGGDIAKAAADADQAREAAEKKAEQSQEVVSAHRKPLLEASWALMGCVEQYAPRALAQLADTIDARRSAVEQAQAALTRARAELAEVDALAAWIGSTEARGGQAFPQVDGALTTYSRE